MRRSRRGVFLRAGLGVIVVIPLSIVGAAFVASSPASAQATPPWYLYDSYPGNSFPPTAPYEAHAPNAVVVEGLYPCEGSNYSVTNVENATVWWIALGYQTATEITPYYWCSGYTNINSYVVEMATIYQDVEAHAPNPGRYWAGFMFDEEPGYGFTASQLEGLNAYTRVTMSSAPGMSYYFTEDQPNGWDVGTYNSIISGSWPAPQVYSTSMALAVNAECSTYLLCTNLVTVGTTMPSPWNDYVWATAAVTGTAWSNAYWGTSTWCNIWRPQ